MQELAHNPKSMNAVRSVLAPRETVLWADRQRGPGKREAKILVIGCVIVTSILAAILIFAPAAIFIFALLWGPSICWAILRLHARHFAITDRRVIFVSAIWPRISGAWEHHDLNPHLVRHAEGRAIIHLTQSHLFFEMRPLGFWSQWYSRVIPTYIENVPNIETVRQLLLREIATASPPEPVARRPSRVVHGTMTG